MRHHEALGAFELLQIAALRRHQQSHVAVTRLHTQQGPHKGKRGTMAVNELLLPISHEEDRYRMPAALLPAGHGVTCR